MKKICAMQETSLDIQDILLLLLDSGAGAGAAATDRKTNSDEIFLRHYANLSRSFLSDIYNTHLTKINKLSYVF